MNGGEEIIINDVKLRAYEPCFEIQNQCDRPGVAGGTTEVNPCVCLWVPLCCTNRPGLIWGVQNEHWAAPSVKVCGHELVFGASELFQGAYAVFVKG